MKIIVSSDFHGDLPIIDSDFDLLLICGDVCPAHDHYYSYQLEWMKNEFCGWVNNLPFKDNNSKVVMTWGNHDFVGERIKKKEIDEIINLTNGRLVILKNESYIHEGLTIFGTPYCKTFYNWAFMLPDEKLKIKYNKIPENVDILISHDSPDIKEYGMIHEGIQSGVNAGNKVLADIVKNKKPKMFFCGHIHSQDHRFMNVDGTWMAGVSYVDEDYVPAFFPLKFDYENGLIRK